MQRRHFEAIAQAIRETRAAMPYDEASELRQEGYERACEEMVRNMLAVCKRANSNFDAGRFREACELETTYRDKSRGRRL